MREILSEIATSTAQSIGTEFLAALVKSMREAMDAKLVFITAGIGDPPTRARSMASWQKDGPRDAFEYDLEGTPCRLVYDGETLVVSEGLYRQFGKEAGYEGYIGVPLRDGRGRPAGHLAVLSDRRITAPEQGLAVVRLFALRAEAEIQRLEHERERDALIQSLTHANRRLANRHNALRESNETKTILLGMVAHDLRNPLAAILARSEFIQSIVDRGGFNADHTARASESCEMIIASVERMDRLIGAVLAQARGEAAAISLEMHAFPAARAVETAVALNAAAAARKRIAIDQDPGAGLVVRGDEDRIIEALDNLVGNAVKYSHPGQRVRIAARNSGRQVVFEVKDRGQGLTPEDCARAFRTFQRLSARPTAGEASSGMGLAIVKAIAEAHGGTVRVESPGKDAGATFSLVLPAGPD